MMTQTTSCLFLKPQVTTAEGEVSQRRDIENFIRPAIEQAEITAIENSLDGLEVSDISDDLVQKIYKADILIIDANCYETAGTFQLSPYLYYYMAIGHLLGNATILVTNTRTHLPPQLITHHTLTYSLREFQRFLKQFKAVVEEIQNRKSTKPDNPIQVYLAREANIKMQAADQQEIARARQLIAEMEEEKIRQKQGGKQPIIFRKVNEKRWE